MKSFLTIGVPVRNEEKSLPTFIRSLRIALSRLQNDFPELSIEFFFCLNGTTDNSAEILNCVLSNSSFTNAKIIFSKPGKINAILEIAKNIKQLHKYVCFIDADVELDEFCITNLFKNLQVDKRIFLTYSCVLPKPNIRKSFVQKIQCLHYSLRPYLNPRGFFHGRAYMMRSGILLEKKPKKIFDSCWNLIDGPYVDDIYLSRLIVHSYGLSSIKECKNSILWFIPPMTVKDFYLGQRRIIFEIKRLNILYPEHSYIQSLFFRKKINWSRLLNINLKYVLLYFPYYLLEESVRLFVHMEMLMISINLIKCKTIWIPVKTSKEWNKYN
jgi:glycosyltransferase involved in cell wall biosynthesis